MTAPLAIPEITLGELLAEMDAEARRLPVQGTIEPTFRCNLNCVHCYVNEPAGSREVRERELPTARVLELIDEIAEAGCLNVLLTGGDHYMHLADLRSYLEADGRLVHLYRDADAWAHKAILNVAASGRFSSDRTVAEYATEIWQARPCPVA